MPLDFELIKGFLLFFLVPILLVWGWGSFLFLLLVLSILSWQALASWGTIAVRDGVAGGIISLGVASALIFVWAGLSARFLSLFARSFGHYRPKSLWIEALVFGLCYFFWSFILDLFVTLFL